MTERESYTPPASPEAISTVGAAALDPDGSYADIDGLSSVPPG